MVTVMQTSVDAAYRECERITREQARNFSWGIRLLPAPKRTALSAVYALARRIDDIGDGGLAVERKAELLDGEAERLAGPPGDDMVLVALADARERYPIPEQSLRDLIEGVRMDVVGTSYATFDELVVYCRRVAGSIGRLCVSVFGTLDGQAEAGVLADDLGVALQLTNILRDVREDAERGRTYLPAEDLERFGAPSGATVGPLVAFEAARAREWYARGLGLIPLLDRRSAACVLAMSGIYRRLLDRIEADPQAILEGRVSLRTATKVGVAMRSFAGGRAR
jgi:15-cis-phytoene synthase